MLLLDQNISRKLVARLQSDYPGTQHVFNQMMQTSEDILIWHYAKKNKLTIVTYDSDFFFLSQYHRFPPKVIKLSRGNLTNIEVFNLLIDEKEKIISFIENDFDGYLEIMPIITND